MNLILKIKKAPFHGKGTRALIVSTGKSLMQLE
jgi:hypothetical protein